MTRDVEAEVAGTVFELVAEAGSAVAAGDPLLVIESMKMEIPVESPVDGTVVEICVAAGEIVTAGQVLVRIEG